MSLVDEPTTTRPATPRPAIGAVKRAIAEWNAMAAAGRRMPWFGGVYSHKALTRAGLPEPPTLAEAAPSNLNGAPADV